ncbi:hypothetical protein E4U17_000896 [Claviceps sp. LM77 group G4]|nr:hypothetical protein E4U17_000896 [Claviceps sp. LM77 group G4]KAG6085944.1 hypothetical protein E4U33_000456 [Claviceps sp. LM78 group G4]
MDHSKDDSKVGWGRRVDARFATPASRNILGLRTTPLSLDKTFIGRTLERSSRLESMHGPSRDRSLGSEQAVLLGALAPSMPAGDRVSEDEAATQFLKDNEDDSTLFPLGLTLKTDKRSRHSDNEATQLCHSCGEALPDEQHCGICGHDFCYKCASERLKGNSDVWTDNSRKASATEALVEGSDANMHKTSLLPTTTARTMPKTPSRGPVTGNPFFLADRYPRGTFSAPQKATSRGLASRPRRLSDCVPGQLLDETTKIAPSHEAECHQHLEQKQDHLMRDTERHSLCCSAQTKERDMDRNPNFAALKHDSIQSKIGKLCRHAEEFHKSHNTLGQNDAEYRPRSRDSMAHTSVTTVAEETPTRLPRRAQPSSLEFDGDDDDDGSSVTERGRNVQNNAPDEEEKRVEFVYPQPLASHDHRKLRPVSVTPGPNSIKEIKGPVDAGVHQESVLRPQPLTLRLKNLDSADSSGRTSFQGTSVLGIDPGFDVNHHKVVPERSVNVLPVATGAENNLPSLTGYKRHRQDTYLCAKPQTPNPEPEPWPRLKKVEAEAPRADEQPSAPWSRQTLGRAPSSLECLHPPEEVDNSPISPRNMGRDHLEREGMGQSSQHKMIQATTPISDWRYKLVKPERSALNPAQVNIVCESCDLTESKRCVSPHAEPSESCSRRSELLMRSVKDNHSSLEDPFTEPRLSIRAIENSLAWKKVQDDFETDCASGKANQVPGSPKRSPTIASNESASEKAKAGCPRTCSWRSRYLRLRDEILSSGDVLALCEGASQWKGNEVSSRYEGSIANELGIEALTVVVHLRHRENLVINTDLRGRDNK